MIDNGYDEDMKKWTILLGLLAAAFATADPTWTVGCDAWGAAIQNVGTEQVPVYRAKATFHPQLLGVGGEADYFEWSFEGCGANPANATSPLTTVTFNKTGIAKVTLKVGLRGSYEEIIIKEVKVFGGPILIRGSERISEQREGRSDGGTEQPWILEFLPGCDQAPKAVLVKAKAIQPKGVMFKWSGIAQAEIRGNDSAAEAYVVARFSSAYSGDSSAKLTYTVSQYGNVYSTTDCTPWKDKAMTSHRPARVFVSEADTINYVDPSFGFVTGQVFCLDLRSQLYHPLPGIDFQERFLQPWELDGIPQVANLPPLLVVNPNGDAFRSGNANLAASTRGYFYHGKDEDVNAYWGLPFLGSTVSIYQRLMGGTTNTAGGGNGIYLGTWKITFSIGQTGSTVVRIEVD